MALTKKVKATPNAAKKKPLSKLEFLEEKKRLVGEALVHLCALSNLYNDRFPKSDDYYSVNKTLHILWKL